MRLGKTLYVTNRRAWRAWLARHHDSEKEIWLVYYRKDSGKLRIPYNDAVEEALCYGWIDSIVKKIDSERFAQRFSPRRPGSALSAANRERIRRLITQKKMTASGLTAVARSSSDNTRRVIASDILKALRADKQTWKNFQGFPASYQRIRIGWIEMARARPEVFAQRLRYFLKMTAQNKKYGMVQ